MKLSERIRNIPKEARPNWTDEEARAMSFFPEWADEVAQLEAENERLWNALKAFMKTAGFDEDAIALLKGEQDA